jgi:hypothetical protein
MRAFASPPLSKTRDFAKGVTATLARPFAGARILRRAFYALYGICFIIALKILLFLR